jgi:uncharacterized protein YjbI with pentapeptide repeats
MSKISELGPITGANTRTEDLFVIVSLILGDDGTKNITRKELVAALQYEIFDRITITGGSISGVRLFNSTLDDNLMNRNTFNGGSINGSDINDGTMQGTDIQAVTIANSSIDGSDFSNGTGNNDVFTNSVIDRSEFNNGTGNNDIFTNSTIDDSIFNNVTIEQGTANGLILTNITIDELILEDALISNSTIITTSFSNGTIFDTDAFELRISNSTIVNTDLDNVTITNSRFANGDIWNTTFANGDIRDTNLDNVIITNSVFANGAIYDTTANNTTITNSSFSDGTGSNNVFDNTTLNTATINDAILANSSFQGSMDNVVATNMQIGSSSSDQLDQNRSTIKDSLFEDGNISNTVIDDSKLVDFDMDLKKVFEAPIDEDSYFALKNVKTGETEQMTYRQLYEEFSRKTEKSLKVYVASDGRDEYPGTILQPVRTLKRAEQLALEKAGGSYDRNDINNAVHISVGPGSYYVDEPIMLPDDCSMTSTAGQYATVIQKKPGWEKTNGILVGSGCYVQGFGYMNFEVDNFDQPEGGFAIAYRPGALMRRSPYIRDSSQLSNFNRLDVEPPLNPFNSKGTILDLGQEFYLEAGHSPQSQFELDDEVTFSSGASGYISYVADIDSNRQIYVRNLKGNVEVGDILYAQRGGTGTVESIGIDDFPNRLVGRGGGCLLADRAVLDTDSLYTYVLCFGFTPRTQNGTGYVAKNGAGVNGIGSLSIFTRQAFFALDGGQMTLNNSGSQFGDISMRARGSTVIIRPAEATRLNLVANSVFADTIEASKEEIIDDMINYLTANTSTGYEGGPGLGYQGYNADKCFRDTGIIVDNVGYDIATNSNYWGRLNGITYRSPISYVVVNEQLTETVGSIEHLKDYMDFIFENTSQDVRDRVDTSVNETLNVLQNGEEFASDIIFASTSGPAQAARELVQDNREFIIEEFIDWLDNNDKFYAYDSAKCKRDIREFILPGVKYDTILDTNYNSVTAGNAYYFKAAKNVIGAQREETVAAYERLRKTTDNLVQANSAVFASEAYEKFNEIIDILKFEGSKFTPTNAVYTPTTGEFVMTIPGHGLEVGRYILLSPESFTFTCDTDGNKLEYKHPRRTDPAFKSLMPIISTTIDTITLNVGSTGYSGVHRLIDVADNSVIVIGSAIEFSDDTSIPADRRNARKQLQSNRQFIQDYMMTWADNEWFFYDSKKCQRDMKNYIVPAVLRDMQSGTNFNSIQSGIAYRQGIAKVAVNDQLTETIGAIDFLRQETADAVTDPIAIHRIDDGYNEIITIARNQSKKYTPTDAAYDPITGIMETTIGSHDFQIGDTIIIQPESMTFECGVGGIQISHPRVTDPAYNTPLTIIAVTATTITVNAGTANGYSGAHTFISATANAIGAADIYDGKFTPSDVDYNPIDGDMTIVIGSHDLPVGKWISIADESITLSCANTATSVVTEISHPRSGDPAFRQPVRITGVTANSITVNVGNANGYNEPHTFVSAQVDCIDTNAIYWTDPAKIDSFLTPLDASYDPTTGEMVVDLGPDHGITTDDHIEFKPQGMVLSCANTSTSVVTEISHPRIGEPNYQMPLEVSAVDTNTITINVGAAPNGYAGVHTFVSAEAGSLIKTPVGVTRQGKLAANQLQANKTFLQDEVDSWLRDNYFVYKDDLCARDTGLILDAVRRDIATGSNINSVFAGLAYRSGNASTQSVIDNELTETVGAIAWLKGQVQTITSGTGLTRADAAFDEIIDIMENGTAAADAIVFGTSYVSAETLKAKTALQANKAFLQAEVTSWIANAYPSLSYNVADCERDLGYFIDAISWDVQHGSNAATLKNARLYFDNAVGVLADHEKPITAEAYKHIGKLAGQIVRQETVTPESGLTQTFDTAITPVGATYDPVTGVMVVDVASHTLSVGDYVVIKEGGITFECGAAPAIQISHPRATDPYFNTPIKIDAVTSTSLTMQVGNAGGYTGAHTFVSALANAIRPSVSTAVSKEVETLFKTIGDIVLEDSFSETYTNSGYGVGTTTPILKEPALAGVGYDSGINEQYARIAGNTVKYQREIIDFIREEYNGLGYDTDLCYRDIGMIVDAITEDMEYGGDAATANATAYYFKNAVSILPYEQREPTRLAYEHLADVIEDVVQEIVVTPTTGNTTLQRTSGLPADASAALRAKNLTNIISSTVDNRLVIPDYTGSLDITQKTPDPLPVANPDTIPAIEPSRTYARKSLQMNKGFIQDEVVAFINDKYFVYNEDKCARDVGYILDAVKRDIQTGSDYPSKYAGRAYRSGNVGTEVVVNEQLAETIEAIKYLRRDIEPRLSGVALTRATAAFDNVINIMKNGTTGLTYSNFGTANVGASDAAATDGLQLNRAFLAAEGKAHFQQTYASLWNSLTVAQRNKCERDIGYMVDAVSFDVRHGSNVSMRDVARFYFENGTSVLPADQRAETAGVFRHVADVARRVVLKQTVTPTSGNGVSQVLTGFNNVVAGSSNDVEFLFNIVSNLIEQDSLFNMPPAQEPNVADPAATGYTQQASVGIVDGRIATLATSINEYLQSKFDYLEYNSVKCRRDVGYMVDAISHDIQYGGNAAMWNAAQIYFVNMTNLLPLDQRDATREAFTRMANVMHAVIRNDVVMKSPGNTAIQNMANLTARREIAAEAKALGMMVANIADDNNPDNLPSRVEPQTAWMPAMVITEKNKVDDSLETLVMNMINFISSEYNGISYPKAKCRRDVGIIVDALSHDVQYKTNYATRLCANMYFDNATSVLPFDQKQQTANFYVEMSNLVAKIVEEQQAGQDITGTPATAVEAEWVADMVRIIEESIRRDGLDALPELIEPDTSWVDASKLWAGEEIDSNLNTLADDVTEFLRDNFTIVDYSKAKCRRDSGYILDAMSWDLNYGGNLASRWNADFYFWNNQLRIPENTREATAQSYRKLGEIVSKVVTGSYPGQATRPETGNETQATQAYDLGLIFYNALFYNTPKALGPTIKPNFEWEDTPKFRFAKDILNNNKTKLQREVQRFITSEYKFIDLPKTYRDAGNLLTILQNDFRFIDPALNTGGSDKATRSFVGALFNIDAQHVFPVFNPPDAFANWRKLRFKGTVENSTARDALTGMKRWDSYIIPINNSGNRYIGEIWYWTGVTWSSAGNNNTDLLESFVGAWERMRDYINTNVATQQVQRTMVTELIDNVLIDSVIRPNFLVFGSLVESIAHQFNGASAGVNRNALPLNFRNVGAAIGANASVLSENGGRIRWSGSDELNNQYFARGLKINGRTGRIEGRPFTSSVRKLARRASNSRASL